MITQDRFTQWLKQQAQPDLTESFGWALPPDDSPPDDIGVGNGGQIAVTGRVGVGKKTLCSTLWGWTVTPNPADSVRHFGRMDLIDLSDDPETDTGYPLSFSGASVILYLIPADQPIHAADLAWVARLRALNTTVVIVANKLDRVERTSVNTLLKALRERFGVPVVPSMANNLLYSHRVFLPALIKACPDAAETLAREVNSLRQRVAWQMTVRAAFNSALLNADDRGEADASALVGVQMSLMRRIGVIYGFKPHGGRGREIVLAFVLTALLRTLPTLTARVPRLRPWMLSGIMAAVTTVIVGRFAVIYYTVSLPHWLRWL